MEDLAPIPHDSPARAGRGRVMVPSLIILFYAVLVSRLPLLNYLGYEYSAAVALILPFIPGLYILEAFKRAGRLGGTALLQALLALVIPLIVGYLNSLTVKNCSPTEGLRWYVLLAGVGMIWTTSLAYFCAAAFKRYILWYLVSLAAVFLHPLALGYFTPRVDSFNLIYGYFPGFTYDEDLRIETVLVHWRGVTLLCALGFLIAGGLLNSRKKGIADATESASGSTTDAPPENSRPMTWLGSAFLVVVCAGLGAAFILRTDLGFETTAGSLRRSLGSLAGTKHFRIYYDSTAIPADEIKWVAAEHEFRFSQVSRYLGTDSTVVIESYIYPDADTKRRLTGAGNTDIAKPWRGEIHLEGQSWRSTLKHELVHALAAEFGMPLIRANVNIGLTEGLAMAASPTFGNRTLREYAASMVHFGIVTDPGSLINPAGFAFESSTVSYVLMGAFVEHLVGRYGIDRFKLWYRGGSAEAAYGVKADSLVAEWKRSLGKVRVPEAWREHTEYYFRRGSIFARECARTIANLNADGGRTLEKKDYPTAQMIFDEALGKSWNAASFTGLIRALLGSRAYGRVIELFEAERTDSAKQGSLAAVRLFYGDALLVVSDYSGARKVYGEIRRLDLSPGMNEAVALRQTVAADPTLSEFLSPVIAGTMDDSVTLEWLSALPDLGDEALISYLKARLMLSKKDYASAAQATANYSSPFSRPELNGALSDITASAFFRLGAFPGAGEFYKRTLEYKPGAALTQRVRDRVERCDWFEREWEGLIVITGRVE